MDDPVQSEGTLRDAGWRRVGERAAERIFYNPDGSLAVTNSGPLHAELNNEPSIETPWLFDFLGQPWKTQEAVRKVLNSIWTNMPNGLPGNDDLGEMSSWYVWATIGMYPEIPARAELVLGSPLFNAVTIRRDQGNIVVTAHGAGTDAPYVQSLKVNGNPPAKLGCRRVLWSTAEPFSLRWARRPTGVGEPNRRTLHPPFNPR